MGFGWGVSGDVGEKGRVINDPASFLSTLHIGVYLFMQKLSSSAESVEKVQMTSSDNFGTLKTQQLTD